MSHPEQLAFFSAVVDTNRELFSGAHVLEIGSHDVNGSLRQLFATARQHVGVDLVEGPGVDVVGFGHELELPDASFDVTVSGECFEHDLHWRSTFSNMVRMTRPGGIVAFTCASHGRPEHGTRRTDETDSPGTRANGLDYYRNLQARDFADLPLDGWFSRHRFWFMPTSFDLYFAGVRSGAEASSVRLPGDDAVSGIRRLMPLSHRLVRLPLRVAAAGSRDEARYQNLVLPYWLFLLRRSAGHHRAARVTVS